MSFFLSSLSVYTSTWSAALLNTAASSDPFLWVLLLPVRLRHPSLLYSTGTVLIVHYVPGLMSVPPSVTTPDRPRSERGDFQHCQVDLRLLSSVMSLCFNRESEWQRPPLAEGRTGPNCPLTNHSVTAEWPHTPQRNTVVLSTAKTTLIFILLLQVLRMCDNHTLV